MVTLLPLSPFTKDGPTAGDVHVDRVSGWKPKVLALSKPRCSACGSKHVAGVPCGPLADQRATTTTQQSGGGLDVLKDSAAHDVSGESRDDHGRWVEGAGNGSGDEHNPESGSLRTVSAENLPTGSWLGPGLVAGGGARNTTTNKLTVFYTNGKQEEFNPDDKVLTRRTTRETFAQTTPRTTLSSADEAAQSEWRNTKVTARQRAAVKDYTEQGYIDINRVLRRGGQIPKEWPETPKINNIDDAIASSPSLSEPITVYRGLSDDRGLNDGDVMTDKGFVSTSINPQTTMTFATSDTDDNSAVMKITVPAGSHAPLLGELSFARNEGEVLLPRGSSFKVTKSSDPMGKRGTRIVEAELVASS